MAKQNYYERVVKRYRFMKRSPVLIEWAKKKKLTEAEFDRAIYALIR